MCGCDKNIKTFENGGNIDKKCVLLYDIVDLDGSIVEKDLTEEALIEWANTYDWYDLMDVSEDFPVAKIDNVEDAIKSIEGVDKEGDYSVVKKELEESQKLENGGVIESFRRFTEGDFNRLTYDDFEGRWSGYVWVIKHNDSSKILGKFNPKKNTLFILGKKDLTNPLVKWLQQNSFVSSDEYRKLEEGGGVDNILSFGITRRSEEYPYRIMGYLNENNKKTDNLEIYGDYENKESAIDIAKKVQNKYKWFIIEVIDGVGETIYKNELNINKTQPFYKNKAKRERVLKTLIEKHSNKYDNGGGINASVSIIESKAEKWYYRLKESDRINFIKKYPRNNNETNEDWFQRVWIESGKSIGIKRKRYDNGGIINENWGNDGSTPSNNEDYNNLYALFPDNHAEAKAIWNQLSDKQKSGFIYDLEVTDAASEHIAESWLEFINSSSQDDFWENATNWDEMKNGGEVGGRGWGEFKKGEKISSLKDIKVGELYLDYNNFFNSKNIILITSGDTTGLNRDIVYASFVRPNNLKNREETFAIWGHDLEGKIDLYKIEGRKYEFGGNVDLDIYPYEDKIENKSKETLVRENIYNGEIQEYILKTIIGKTPEYPHEIVGSLKLTKCFLRPYYKI
jgi:hypothetical protein